MVNKLGITAVILTKNEEAAIARCVSSLSSFDQILVIDSSSIDRTAQLARSMGATVINFDWNRTYPKKKQWALELPEIQNEWVLFLDADECASIQLISEIERLLTSGTIDNFGAYDVKLDYYFTGKLLKFGHKVKKRVLVNKNFCSFPVIDDLHVANMWEVEGHYQPNCSKLVGNLISQIEHLDPDPLYDYFARHNRYSDWEAELRLNKNMRNSVRKSRSIQGEIFDRVPFKPVFFFLYSYFFRFGWRDGKAGFNYSLALSFYYWQISVKTLEKKINAKTI
jgi:glycosyltransferase involved in cell wall biosynthesis